jgi:hypothetical protein
MVFGAQGITVTGDVTSFVSPARASGRSGTGGPIVHYG